MNIKQFLVSIPHLCQVDNAERWSKVIELQFDEELKNPGSVFARNAKDEINPANRLETVFGFGGGESGRVEHCRKLTEILGLSHYRHEHGENKHVERLNELIASALVSESEYPDIAKIMSVEQAVQSSSWNG